MRKFNRGDIVCFSQSHMYPLTISKVERYRLYRPTNQMFISLTEIYNPTEIDLTNRWWLERELKLASPELLQHVLPKIIIERGVYNETNKKIVM